MKLLIDQNLSPKLIQHLNPFFEDIHHVSDLELDKVNDIEIFQYAEINGFTILTKDSDFSNLISIIGFPPKVIWIRLGNCSTRDVLSLIKDNMDNIMAFENDKFNGIFGLV